MIEPKLRFKTDDGSQFPDWEEKVFGDFVDTHLEKTSDKDKYPLYSLTIESGVQPKTDRYEREFLVKKEGDNYKIVPPNAFVYNPMNLRFGALKVNHEKFSVSVSGYYDVFSLKDDSVLAFWENYLVTSKMLNYYFSIATGSLIEKLRVHYSQFVKIKKPLPSLPEQQKIAEFLSTIDTVIEKQKETVSAWEERKKGVMQKLFSQEVRFKADDGSDFPEWEEKNVSSLGNIVGGGTPSTKQKEYWCGKTAWVSSADISDNDIYNINMTRFITQDAIDDSATKIIPKGSILIVSRVGVGKVAKAACDLCTSQDFTNIVNPDGDSTFLSYAILRLMQSKLQCVQGTSIKGIPSDEIKNYMLRIPCLAEQQKIADCLSSLDDVIEKQKATLEAWKEMKKGLLQKMFV